MREIISHTERERDCMRESGFEPRVTRAVRSSERRRSFRTQLLAQDAMRRQVLDDRLSPSLGDAGRLRVHRVINSISI